MSLMLDDPRHWHDRADETRAIAKDAKDHWIKRVMLDIAYDYDRLAHTVSRRVEHGLHMSVNPGL